MKRLASLLILGTAALLIPNSLHAQRGMPGHGSGGFARGSGFHSSAPSGVRSSGGFRSGPAGGFRSSQGFRSGPGFSTFGPGPRSAGFSRFAPSGQTFARGSFVSRNHVFINHPFGFRRFRNHFGFFDGCFGCFSPFFFGSGLFLGSPFYPYYPGDYYGDYGYGQQAPAQPVVVNSDNGSSVELAAEVQRLTDEVDDLRGEESRRYADDRAQAATSGRSMTAKEPAAGTVFIFRDGRRISAQSYAITGQTLWIFSEQAARKYQLADLDVTATEQTNSANGIEIHIPDGAPHH